MTRSSSRSSLYETRGDSVRLDPLTAPRRTRALAALCQQLNTTATRYPGTRLTLRYEVKDHPGTA